MSLQIQGGNNYLLNVDSNNNVFVSEAPTRWPASGGTSGGFFSVAGYTSAVVAASLAANTTLMSMRLSASSQRKAYITKARIMICAATAGTSALVPGTIGLQRFSGATPTGGTARTPNRMSEISGNTSDMTDIRDSNAALTVTSVNFGPVISTTLVPLFIASGLSYYEAIMEPPQPLVLDPGEGFCIRSQVAMPATQTWMYSYNIYWTER